MMYRYDPDSLLFQTVIVDAQKVKKTRKCIVNCVRTMSAKFEDVWTTFQFLKSLDTWLWVMRVDHWQWSTLMTQIRCFFKKHCWPPKIKKKTEMHCGLREDHVCKFWRHFGNLTPFYLHEEHSCPRVQSSSIWNSFVHVCVAAVEYGHTEKCDIRVWTLWKVWFENHPSSSVFYHSRT